MQGYEALANAVIIQAAKDFRAARRRLAKSPNSTTAQRTIREVEAFLRSSQFIVLSGVNGERLLNLLKEEKAV